MNGENKFSGKSEGMEKEPEFLLYLKGRITDHHVTTNGDTLRFYGQFSFRRNVIDALFDVRRYFAADKDAESVQEENGFIVVIFREPKNGIKRLEVGITKDE